MSHTPSSDAFDIVVYIGAFQPWTSRHQAQLETDLTHSGQVVLAVTGANRARSTRHPFTLDEQIQLLRQALSPAQRAQVSIMALHLPYASAPGPQPAVVDWQAAAAQVAGHTLPKVAFRHFGVHHLILPSSWHELPAIHTAPDELAWRRAALAGESPVHPLQEVPGFTSPACTAWFEQWLQQPIRDQLHHEWRQLQQERDAWASAPYPVSLVTVDAVVECGEHVLLIRRGRSPGRGLLALPGGFIDVGETLLHSALRELHEETGLHLTGRVTPRAHAVFDAPERSERGRVITQAWHFRIDAPGLPHLRAGDDASEAMWVPATQLNPLVGQFHDDHDVILQYFLGLPQPPAIQIRNL